MNDPNLVPDDEFYIGPSPQNTLDNYSESIAEYSKAINIDPPMILPGLIGEPQITPKILNFGVIWCLGVLVAFFLIYFWYFLYHEKTDLYPRLINRSKPCICQ